MNDPSAPLARRYRRPWRVRLAEAAYRWWPASPDWLRTALSIQGLVLPGECRLLFRLARQAMDGPIVEIGTYRGRATAALALGSRAGGGLLVYAIDPHRPAVGVLGQVYGPQDAVAWRRNMARAGVTDLVREVAEASVDAARSWRQPIAFLFVDGDHSYGAVRADVAAWAPHLLADGFMALHDSVIGDLGPARLVDELVMAGSWSIVERLADTTVLRRAPRAADLPADIARPGGIGE